jgi:hypothetical protein
LEAVSEIIFSDDDFSADGTIELRWYPDGIDLADQNFEAYPKPLMSVGDNPVAGCEYAGSMLHEKEVRECRKRQKQMEVRAPKKYSKHAQPKEVFPGRPFEKCRDFLGDLENDGSDEDAYVVYGFAPGLDHPNYAWVMLPNGIVFDAVMQRFYSEEKFRDAGFIEFGRFTWLEEIRLAQAMGDDELPQIVPAVADARQVALMLLKQYGVND